MHFFQKFTKRVIDTIINTIIFLSFILKYNLCAKCLAATV